MSIKVTFQNPRTGELRQVKVGFSWTLLLFATILGIPLFMRKLHGLGFVAVGLWLANIVLPEMVYGRDAKTLVAVAMFIVLIVFGIWIGMKGNELTGKKLLDLGWQLANPDSLEANYARQRWQLMPVTSHAETAQPSARSIDNVRF